MNTAILTRNLKSAKLNAVRSSVRHGGHFLKKNIWVEENAGLRENTYKTWKFTMARSIKIFAFLILPGVVFYSACVEEEKKRDIQLGRERKYGVLPRKFD